MDKAREALLLAKQTIDEWVEDEHGRVHVHKDVIRKAVEAALASLEAAPDWEKVVLGLSWIPLHVRHDVLRALRTAAPVPAAGVENTNEKIWKERAERLADELIKGE